jgi:hypothetical protein
LRRVAIYTAIFGDYDELKAPVAQDIDCDFFCFTDQVKPRKLHPWRTISVRRMASLSPRMQAKWFKVANHHVFPSGRLKMGFAVRAGHLLGGSRYEATIWGWQPSDQGPDDGSRNCGSCYRWIHGGL